MCVYWLSLSLNEQEGGCGWHGMDRYRSLMWRKHLPHLIFPSFYSRSILPPFSFILSISLPVLLSSSLFSILSPSLSTSALLIRPPTYHTGFLIAVCSCVWNSLECVHSGLALCAVCEAICVSVRVLWAQHAVAQGGGWSEKEQQGENAILESEKRLGKEGNPVQGEMWESRFGTVKLKWTEVSSVMRDKIRMKLSCSLWGDLVAGSSAINFYRKTHIK